MLTVDAERADDVGVATREAEAAIRRRGHQERHTASTDAHVANVRSGPSRRDMASFTRDAVLAHPVLLIALVVWTAAPLALLVVHVLRHGGVLTGADGTDPFDQLAYLAWIRDAGTHILASNLWHVGGTPHDYLHPLFLISGLMWRAGLPIQLAFLVWRPVAIFTLFVGFAAFIWRFVPGRRGRSAALALALFYQSPVVAIMYWVTQLRGSSGSLTLAAEDPYAAWSLWGFDHTAIAMGLTPLFLLGGWRLLDAEMGGAPQRGLQVLTAGAGALVAWLYPWQAIELLTVLGLLFAVRGPRRRYRVLWLPIVGVLLPLLYGVVLSHVDPTWRTFQANTISQDGLAPWWALLAAFAPIATLAAFGWRVGHSDGDWMLRLWVVSDALVYLFLPEFHPHALAGVSLPLSILAVRGAPTLARRLRLRGHAASVLAAVGLSVGIVPAALYHLDAAGGLLSHSSALSSPLVVLTDQEADALRFLAEDPQPGAVLAPPQLSMSVPGFTGRPSFAGHWMWQPAAHEVTASRFFASGSDQPSSASRRAILTQSGARFVIVPCDAPSALGRQIAPEVREERQFGCVTVYETVHPARRPQS